MPNGPNVYVYVNGNPVMNRDPLGLFFRAGDDEAPTGLYAYTIAVAIAEITDRLAGLAFCSECATFVEDAAAGGGNPPATALVGLTLFSLLFETEFNIASRRTRQPEIAERIAAGDLNNGYSFPGQRRVWLLDHLIENAHMCAIEHMIVHELSHVAGLPANAEGEMQALMGTMQHCGFFREECQYEPVRPENPEAAKITRVPWSVGPSSVRVSAAPSEAASGLER